MQDEVKALQLCQNKVRQKKLPMEVVDAEYQWWVSFFFLASIHVHPLFVVGIDVNSRFTSLLRNGSTSESWYGNCFGAPSVSRHSVWLLIHDVDCTKRGSGWHPSRALLAWNSDHGPSLASSEALISLDFSPNSCSAPFFSHSLPRIFFYICALITACACFDWYQPFCTNFHLWCHIPSVLEFLDYWYIPTQTCCTNRFLSFFWYWFFGLAAHLLRLPVSSNRVGDYEEDRESYGCVMFIYSSLHSCITILNKSRCVVFVTL